MQPLQTVKTETLLELFIISEWNFEKRLNSLIEQKLYQKKKNRSHSLWIIRNKTITFFFDQNQP